MEKRVYLIDTNENPYIYPSSLSNELFIQYAEEQGNVYSIEGFERAFNDGQLDLGAQYIRILEI